MGVPTPALSLPRRSARTSDGGLCRLAGTGTERRRAGPRERPRRATAAESNRRHVAHTLRSRRTAAGRKVVPRPIETFRPSIRPDANGPHLVGFALRNKAKDARARGPFAPASPKTHPSWRPCPGPARQGRTPATSSKSIPLPTHACTRPAGKETARAPATDVANGSGRTSRLMRRVLSILACPGPNAYFRWIPQRLSIVRRSPAGAAAEGRTS